MIEILKQDFVFEDDRGALYQLVHDGFRQINAVYSKAGSVRGNHSHRLNSEAFFVIEGSFELRYGEGSGSGKRNFHKGDMFLIPPGVSHSFSFLEDTILIGMYDIGVELADGTKDIVAAD